MCNCIVILNIRVVHQLKAVFPYKNSYMIKQTELNKDKKTTKKKYSSKISFGILIYRPIKFFALKKVSQCVVFVVLLTFKNRFLNTV